MAAINTLRVSNGHPQSYTHTHTLTFSFTTKTFTSNTHTNTHKHEFELLNIKQILPMNGREFVGLLGSLVYLFSSMRMAVCARLFVVSYFSSLSVVLVIVLVYGVIVNVIAVVV